MVITSKQNALVQKVVALQSKKGRRSYRQYIIEGRKQVQEAILYKMPIVKILFSTSFIEKDKFTQQLVEDVDCVEIADNLFERISINKTPQGILAVLHLPDTTPKEPKNRALLLDGVSDSGNLGTILRSANAFGVRDIYLRNCVDPFSPKVVQASMGGLFFVRVHIGELTEILQALENMPLITADIHGENIHTFAFPEQCCIVFGNEGNGICQELKDLASKSITIPMQEQAESLNVAVAASIVLFAMQK